MDFSHCRRQSTACVAAEGDACAPPPLGVRTRAGGTEGSGSQWHRHSILFTLTLFMCCGHWSVPQGLAGRSIRQWTRSLLLL